MIFYTLVYCNDFQNILFKDYKLLSPPKLKYVDKFGKKMKKPIEEGKKEVKEKSE